MFINMWNYGTDTTGKFKADGAELYAYLLESYAEPGEASAHDVHSILAQLERDTDTTREGILRRRKKRGGVDNPRQIG